MTSQAGGSATVTLSRDTNQALGIGQFAIDFVRTTKYGGNDNIDKAVWHRVKLFHTDSVMCGISALALKCNAPSVLRNEALLYIDAAGAAPFGSAVQCAPEKAIVANASAVREWDSNGTVFGYNPNIAGHQAGEFGHNDFYPVVISAAQVAKNIDGQTALRAMLCLDEIRARLAEVFSLKTYKIDHVVHGAIASAAVYGALLGATAEQIESAIGMTVAHYVPFRAIRAGKQLSDSKGASAALSAEAAVLSMRRAMNGFIGPGDVFRNPEAIFRHFEKQEDGHSPFNIVLTHSGSDFGVTGMHFKLGLYEHQSAGALEGIISLLANNPGIVQGGTQKIKQIRIKAYEPAFGIIGDPAKRDPATRQSADHSMLYIVSTLLTKAMTTMKADILPLLTPNNLNSLWRSLMLTPYDYSKEAIHNPETRALMGKIVFEHGGAEYDKRYPEGIPTSIEIECIDGSKVESGMVLFPSGHARNTDADLNGILSHKFKMMGEIALKKEDVEQFITKQMNIESMTSSDLSSIYMCDLRYSGPID